MGTGLTWALGWAGVTGTLLGAGFASGSVALARRADSKLIGGDEDPVLSLEGDDSPLVLEGD